MDDREIRKEAFVTVWYKGQYLIYALSPSTEFPSIASSGKHACQGLRMDFPDAYTPLAWIP